MWLAEGPTGVMAWKKKNSFQKKRRRERTGRDEVVVWGSDGGRKGREGRRRREWQEQQRQQRWSLFPLQLTPGSHRQQGEWVSERMSERVMKWISEWVFCSYFSHQSFTATGITNVWLWVDWFLMVRVKSLKDAAKANSLLLINQIVWWAESRCIMYAWDFFPLFSATVFICLCVCWRNPEAAWFEVFFFLRKAKVSVGGPSRGYF